LPQRRVDGFQAAALWQGDEVVAPRIAHQIFDAALILSRQQHLVILIRRNFLP
jgi:hypothetical protein